MKIFISYTRRDNELTESDFRKIQDLINNKYQIFIHFFNPKINSQKEIESEVLNSDILILIKTRESFLSKWVLTELKTAQSANIPIFYITINDLRY
ncbi:TIR domain-containing protein [Acinetobacter bereziniae]|uniref:TIR domain-containing protein n=1 Tax=Acinetobacter bereziniae TaxID=106648 RepID=UPI0039C34162